jgi:hypothetical protein
MKLTVRRFLADDLGAVHRFNARLEAAGELHRVDPEGPETGRDGEPVTGRLFVALEGDELRGACWLHEQDVWIAGEQRRAGFLRLPLSESVVNPAYRGVPGSLIMQMMRVQPRLMALGLGAHDTAVARLLAAFKWNGVSVPMRFAIVRPMRVLRGLSYAREQPRRRMAMDLAAFSGLGGLAGSLLSGARLLRLAAAPSYDATVVSQYGPWTDGLWEQARSDYGLVPARNAATLNWLYRPDFFADFHRLRVQHRGADVGLASVLRADFGPRIPDPYFGHLRVGLIADMFGCLAHARGITAATVRFLLGLDVDLIVGFQLHPTWSQALSDVGFHAGPSNFCWYRNPAVETLLSGAGLGVPQVHLNRADAEGPKWF